ncbi:MAG TPA: hypothetical protein DEQ64_23030 [Lachnoclostridium sp.]|jgi:hypothetical protein|uniref:hypothetical protein n=1 Tax=Lacrimispora sp. TaxID=2719234 RepID=UPI000ECC8B69|nr:hypothetical protein [Lacrimispora sp.]HCD46544.1 hypothetical protein [Lachnoclostridium sp.]
MNGKVKTVWKLIHSGKKPVSQETIGIIGTGRGVGVTHFTVMTAGYLGGVLRKRCAVLEWNSHGDFRNLRKLCAKEKAQAGCFKVLEADYYERAGIDTLLLCKKSGYQAVIVDYGTVKEGNLEEFLRCDRQFVLGSLSEWQLEAFLEFERKGKKAEKSWKTLVSFGSEEARRNGEKRLNIPIARIPVSVDVFAVTGDTIGFYQQFF